MAYYQPNNAPSPYGGQSNPQNLQFYSSSYGQQPVSGHSTPFQANNGAQYNQAYGQAPSGGYGGGFGGYGGAAGVSGRMGEQGGLRTGWLAALGTEGYEEEPPLLEELGVNFAHIKLKTLTVMNPLARVDQHIMDDADLAGPLLFFILFGTFLLFSGKVHFGYIYGLALVGSLSLHFILSLMSPPTEPGEPIQQAHPAHPMGSSHFGSSLTYSRSASVLGYCLIPLVVTSLIGVLLPMDTFFGYLLTSAAVFWCTVSSSAMFCAVGGMKDMRGLVAYPLALFYCGFGIMGIFSSKGSGGLAGMAAKTPG